MHPRILGGVVTFAYFLLVSPQAWAAENDVSPEWAAVIPRDRTIQVRCTFIARADDSGLGARFGSEAPLLLRLDQGRAELVNEKDRSDLGRAVSEKTLPRGDMLIAFEGGALPVFDPARETRLSLLINPDSGASVLILRTRLKPNTVTTTAWVRDGGCRPGPM